MLCTIPCLKSFCYIQISQVVSPLDFNIDDAIGNILTEFGIDEGDFGIEHNETNTSLSRNSTQEEILNIHKIFISGKNIEDKIFEYDKNGNISFYYNFSNMAQGTNYISLILKIKIYHAFVRMPPCRKMARNRRENINFYVTDMK